MKYLFFTLLFCFCISINAEVKKVKFSAKATSVNKWQVIDIVFKAKSKTPFTTEFYAMFTAPSGKTQKVPGFYNGGNEWLLRFSGSEAGEWNYVTKSEIKALNNKKGSVTIVNKVAENQKGSIVIPESDPEHFYYEDGSPYFLMAFECDWLYALDYHNETALPKSEHLLNLLQDNGLNQVVMNVFSYDVNWRKDEKLPDHPEHEFGGPKDIFPFLGTNENPDYSSLNIEFFKKFDRTIELMNEKGIVSHLMIYVWNKLVAWPDMYSDADNMYYDYVVKRYGAFPNIMWDVSKEALFYGRADDKYILERLDRFRKKNHFNRLITVHDYGFCKRHPESVDYISRQDWTYSLYTNMLNDRNKYKGKPVFNIEHGGYEESHYVVFPGSYINAEQCLKRNYQCAFAGVYSTYYWQGTSWNVVIYNPFEQGEPFYKPKFEYYKHFSSFFNQYTFKDYQPTPWHNQAGYCLKHKNEEKYLNYVPKETYQYRKEFMFKDKKPVYYKWFNTLTGEYSEEGKAEKKMDFVCPWYGEADAILILWK